MGESKFLKYQDKNGDFLNDTCDDLVNVEPTQKCPTCAPNPNYVSPNWKKQNKENPWFDEKACKYQITIDTSKSSLVPHSGSTDLENNTYIDELFEEHSAAAIDHLLLGFDKLRSIQTQATVQKALTYQKFYLDPRPNSFVKLLYSIPYEDFNPLSDASDPDEEETDINEDEEETDVHPLSGRRVTLTNHEFFNGTLKVREALGGFLKDLKIFRSLHRGNLIHISSGALFDLSLYGDLGLRRGLLFQIQSAIEDFLSKKGLNLTIKRVREAETPRTL